MINDRPVQYSGKEVNVRRCFCLTRWASSKGVSGDEAYSMEEKFKTNGEIIIEATVVDDAS